MCARERNKNIKKRGLCLEKNYGIKWGLKRHGYCQTLTCAAWRNNNRPAQNNNHLHTESLNCDVLKRSDCFVAARSMWIQVCACVCVEGVQMCKRVHFLIMFNSNGPISVNIILITLEGPSQYISKHKLKLMLAVASLKWWPYEMVAQIVNLHKRKRSYMNYIYKPCSGQRRTRYKKGFEIVSCQGHFLFFNQIKYLFLERNQRLC